MSTLSDDEAIELLRAAMPLERRLPPDDLWPQIRRRIDHTPHSAQTSDWLLVLALALLCLLHPSLAGLLLLHF